MSATAENGLSNYDLAQNLIEQVETDTNNPDSARVLRAACAQVHATLAQVDAIEALTAAIEARELPTLELVKVGGGRLDPQYRIRPVKP